MNYNPATKKIEIHIDDATSAYHDLRWALLNIRKAGNRPLDKHKRPGQMDEIGFAGCGILNAAKKLGITMGAEWPEELDLRDAG